MSHKNSESQTEEAFCYECQSFNNVDIMQKVPCSNCNGRKCFLHGGRVLSVCSYCNTENLCADCSAFLKCCHEPGSGAQELKYVGREIVILKKELEIVKRENQILKKSLKDIVNSSNKLLGVLPIK